MDASEVFATHIVKCGYEQISKDAIEGTKKDTLDTLGVAIAASGMLGNREIVELIREMGGKKESTILVYGDRVPAPHAALVNGAMARTLDWDDTHDESTGCHPGPSIVSGTFSLAERIGGVSGKEFLTAATIGIDLGCRLMWAGAAGAKPPSPIVPGFVQQWACIAVAAACSKLLGLDEEKTLNALGIAYCQAAGNAQPIFEGVEMKGIQVGFGAQAGILSALIAEKGIRGPRNSLEGKCGMYNLYYRGQYAHEILTRELGKRFESVGLTIKPYPCCRYIHASIDATLALIREHNINAEDVEEITVLTDIERVPFNVREPVEAKQQPKNSVEAQFSIPWGVATALVRKRVSLKDIGAVTDSNILRMAQKVTILPDQSLSASVGKGMPPAIVKIATKEGWHSKRVDFPLGSLENPVTWEGLAAKFRDCVTYAATPLPNANIEKVIDLTRNLETVEDVSQVMRLLTS